MDEAVPEHAVRVDMSSQALRSQLCGAGRGDARSRKSGASADHSCARFLGLPSAAKSAKSSRSSVCRRLLGLEAVATDSVGSVSQVLGLSKPSRCGPKTSCSDAPPPLEEHAAFENYKVGDLYVCQCGWRPPTKGLSNNQIAYRAKKHWRHCVGKLPPNAASQQVRQRVARGAWCNPVRKRELAKQRYLTWYNKLKGKWRDAACVPDFDNPLSTSGPNRSVVIHQYRCKHCSRQSSAADFKRYPCSARDRARGISKHSWITKMQGPESLLFASESCFIACFQKCPVRKRYAV